MDYVARIATSDTVQRKNAIMEILREEGIPFFLQRAKENETLVENIVISTC